MADTTGTVPTDQTGSTSSDYTNGLVDAFELFAKRGAEIAADALTNRDGRADRGTGGGDQAGEDPLPWYKQPMILGAAAVALVLILVLKRR